nr:immunoglobulin light chain junction region [Macaca mulatta]
CYQHYSGCTF